MNLSLAMPASTQELAQQDFSCKQLITYSLCPQQFAHCYVLGTQPESRPLSLIFRKAIRATAEQYYRHLMATGETMNSEDMKQLFTATLSLETKRSEIKICFKKGETLEGAEALGRNLVDLFLQHVRPSRILAVGMPFSVPIPDLVNGGHLSYSLVGSLPLIEGEENTYLISELKTSAHRYNSLKLEHDLKATVYSYALTHLNHEVSETACRTRYDLLVTTKTPAFEQYFVDRTANDHLRLVQLLNHVLRAIEQGIFYRNQGWQCTDCSFRSTCLG